MILLILSYTVFAQTIVFPGLGDDCNNAGMKHFAELIKADCIEVGVGALTSIFSDFSYQAKQACETVKAKYAGKQIKAVGICLSQGALIARYIVTDCDFGGKVTKLLSIGGPQMGVSAFPHCFSGILCYPVNAVVKLLVYTNLIQRSVGPAGYFRNYHHLDEYLESSHFLPDINNERNFKQSRKDRFSNLDAVMLVKFTKDSMIHPRETSFFQVQNEKGVLLKLEESDFYKNDLIGFKSLNQRGRIQFVEINGDHLQTTIQDLEEYFIPFLQ